MTHPVVEMLRFTRSEWQRGLRGVTEEEAARHFGQMNSVGWIVGHLAWHEQRTLFLRRRGELLFPEINELFAFGAPMSTPSLKEMRRAWSTVTKAADPFLDSVTTKDLTRDLPLNGKRSGQNLGSALRRMTFHYWFHIGEIQAIRQMLGHKRLPQYVGNLEATAAYRPER
ncbi:MAG TPA: DinB family protein [Candidatus Dormibacteraeota bacterium]|nr:DinB family protein [Candidatus Dormibacteraeota bacterium]